jgi:tetratricopeptide (TPR) repeat protein
MELTHAALRDAVHDAVRAGQLDEQVGRRALAALASAPDGGGPAALSAAGVPRPLVEWLVGRARAARTAAEPPSTASGTSAGLGSSSLSMSSRLGLGKLPAGSRVGPFTVESELGRGGMGVVMRAHDDAGRAVALKLVLGLRDSTLKRFGRETAALAKLDHPNVVRYVGAGEEPTPWLAMELVEGQDLRALMHGPKRLALETVVRLLEGVARGVAHAHAHGIIHRDLKPSNVLVRGSGEAVVTDFGLAKSLDASRFTQTGAMLGTLSTMAPEQVLGASVGPPADVWALGVMLFECLTGRGPFEDDSAMALSAAIVHETALSPRGVDPSVPADLDATCRACLARDPALRPTALEVARALRDRRAPRGGPARGKRPGASLGAGVAAVAVVLALAVAAALLRADRDVPGPPAATDVTASPRPVAPWGPPGAAWSLAWSLDAGPACEVPTAALWDEPGRRAAPLAAVLEDRPGARAAALQGAARTTGAGRLAVEYDLARAVTPRVLNPAYYVQDRAAPYVLVRPHPDRPGAIEATSQNDSSQLALLIGGARWREPAVSLAWRRLARIDGEDLSVRVGYPDAPRRDVAFSGRKAAATSGAGSAVVPWTDAWRRVRFAPGGAAGSRVVVDDATVPALDVAATERPGPGRVSLYLNEVQLGLADLEVEGALARPDLPALAWAPVTLPPRARVVAAFTRGVAGQALGGPLVALGAPDGARLTLELDGARLALLRDDQVVAIAPVTGEPTAGYLLLELEHSEGGVVRGLLVAEQVRVALEVAEPLPLGAAPLRAAWGSSAPEVEFTAVELHAGTADPVAEATAEWRRGALLLARMSDAAWLDDALMGTARAIERRLEATRAADLLARAVDLGLAGPARDDALARAVFARVVAADASGAGAAARRAVEVLGGVRARDLVDRLEWHEERPVLVHHLVSGYATVYDVPVRDAALVAAEVLAPDCLGRVLAARAVNVRHRGLAPGSPEQRAAYEAAAALFERALQAGATSLEVDGPYADTLMDLDRFADAVVVWDRALVTEPVNWWSWLRKAECMAHLGSATAALECAVGALACAPRRAQVHDHVLGYSRQASPGLAACALDALARLRDEPAGGPLQAAALERARAAARDGGRDGDLARFVLAREGGPPMAPRPRPTAVLARARAGASDAREALALAAREDALVRHLARLDPELAPLLD